MARHGDIDLGDIVKDSITDLRGVVVAITDWLNGCQRVTVQPKELKDGKPVETSTFDVEQLELLHSVKVKRTASGGPSITPTRAADPR
jgi:hypothetical protein